MEFSVLRRDFSKWNKTQGVALAIGNFDGVHKGHQTLLSKLLELSDERKLLPALYTFEPHPRKLFLGGAAPRPITMFASKAKVLKDFGLKLVVGRPFNKAFASTHFLDFAQHLSNDLNVKLVVVGEDFVFGKGREGTAEKLKEAGKTLGFDVEIVSDITCNAGERISSSRIRELLNLGDVKKAGLFMGRPFAVRSYLFEDDYCNLVAHFSGYTLVKNGVYWVKVQYTDTSILCEPSMVPMQVKNNVGYIAPLPDLPDMVEGKIILRFIDQLKTEEK